MCTLACDGELRGALDRAFAVFEEPTPERYAYITAGEDGRCPVLDEHGWCRLHSRCGEDVQPAVCRLFPRSIKPGELTEAVCSGACERVIEMLTETDAPLRFVTVELETSSPPPSEGMSAHDRARRRQCMALWQEDGVPYPERLERIGAYLGQQKPPSGGSTASHGVRLLRELGVHSGSLRAAAERILAWDGAAGDGAFADAAALAEKRMPRLGRQLENIVANHMYYVQFPYVGEGIPPGSAWDGLYGLYAMLYVIAVHAACVSEDPATAFTDDCAAALRYAEHTDFYHNAHIVLRRE